VRSWDLHELAVRPHSPEIISSGEAARAIVLELPAGEGLREHQVHERAWVVVIDGEAEITAVAGEQVSGKPGVLIEFDPAERHAVQATTKTRLLLLLAPWPGEGHPGTMALSEKAAVRERAAEHEG
jgi:quercetin dioxygenase-like cupin family protein